MLVAGALLSLFIAAVVGVTLWASDFHPIAAFMLTLLTAAIVCLAWAARVEQIDRQTGQVLPFTRKTKE